MRKIFNTYSLELVRESAVEYDNTSIKTTNDAYQKILEVFKLDRKAEEHMVMLALNNKNYVVGAFVIAKGTMDETLFSIPDIIKRTLLCNGTRVILAHNHPSGEPDPSETDLKSTARIKQALDIIGITLLDHIVVGEGKYVSIFKQIQGLGAT